MPPRARKGVVTVKKAAKTKTKRYTYVRSDGESTENEFSASSHSGTDTHRKSKDSKTTGTKAIGPQARANGRKQRVEVPRHSDADADAHADAKHDDRERDRQALVSAPAEAEAGAGAEQSFKILETVALTSRRPTEPLARGQVESKTTPSRNQVKPAVGLPVVFFSHPSPALPSVQSLPVRPASSPESRDIDLLQSRKKKKQQEQQHQQHQLPQHHHNEDIDYVVPAPLPIRSSPPKPPPKRHPDAMAYISSSQQRYMRACMVCSIVRTEQQFKTQGCPNCESFLELRGNSETIQDCTSQVFEGLITISDTSKSWVARYQRLEGYVPGVYAVQVEGIVSLPFPDHAKVKVWLMFSSCQRTPSWLPSRPVCTTSPATALPTRPCPPKARRPLLFSAHGRLVCALPCPSLSLHPPCRGIFTTEFRKRQRAWSTVFWSAISGRPFTCGSPALRDCLQMHWFSYSLEAAEDGVVGSSRKMQSRGWSMRFVVALVKDGAVSTKIVNKPMHTCSMDPVR